MKIEDDLKMHSHYIEDLFMNKNETIEEIGIIKEAISDMRENVGIHASTHSLQNENIMKSLDELNKNDKELKERFDSINDKAYSRFYLIEFVRELLNSPKNWILVIVFIITIELTIGFSEVLKHLLRLG